MEKEVETEERRQKLLLRVNFATHSLPLPDANNLHRSRQR